MLLLKAKILWYTVGAIIKIARGQKLPDDWIWKKLGNNLEKTCKKKAVSKKAGMEKLFNDVPEWRN